MRKILFTLMIAQLALIAGAGPYPKVSVTAEEDVYDFTNPDNGSGPLWSYGCTPIARIGEAVYVCQMETGKDIPPLCNTRWRLLRRDVNGWNLVAEADAYRQREPGVLAVGPAQDLFLNVNDSTQPEGTKYGNCTPRLLRFAFNSGQLERSEINPMWAGKPCFTDHSYRGYASDPANGRLLMMNIDAKTGIEHTCLLSVSGDTLANAPVSFPIRACYPQVALSGYSVHVQAVGDIVEPVEEWRQYKHEQTGRDWDYVFRILYYSFTPDIRNQDFLSPLEIANVDATGGHISNKDLWLSPAGEVFLMYTEREVASPLLRDKYFPGKSIIDSLKLAVVKDGIVVSRRTLVAGNDQESPGDARFHVTPDGKTYAVINMGGQEGGNKLLQIYPVTQNAELIPIPLARPFSSFLLASARAGNAPSNIIDMIGYTNSGDKISYAQIHLEPGE